MLDMKTQGIRMEMPITVAVVKPDKVRFEIKNPILLKVRRSLGRPGSWQVSHLQQQIVTCLI